MNGKSNEFVASVFEAIGGLLVIAMFIFLAWLFLVITPDQNSAECDALREEMRQKGIIE
jgi:hypothetical protein